MTNEEIGNDGLTDAERDELAEKYRREVTRALSPDELAAIAKWRKERNLLRGLPEDTGLEDKPVPLEDRKFKLPGM